MTTGDALILIIYYLLLGGMLGVVVSMLVLGWAILAIKYSKDGSPVDEERYP